jgi:hypothetical protein
MFVRLAFVSIVLVAALIEEVECQWALPPLLTEPHV